MIDVDVLVVGSGFAGSLVSLGLLARGRRVALVERGRHPRFAIGESSTPVANLLLERLADTYDLPGIRPFSKWGTWQRARPDVAGGLKRGFTFYFHEPTKPFADDDGHERQLLVAASPRNEIADTHWYRPDFDHALVVEAERGGAVYLDDTALETPEWAGDRVRVEGVRQGQRVGIAARFLVDASGPRGFLCRTLGLGQAPLRWLPHTEAVYSHFEGVRRWETMLPTSGVPPYPPDDAAMHHVCPGGWAWVLRFNNGVTSAGAALTPALASRLRRSDGASTWQRWLEWLPSVGQQFEDARAVQPFVYSSGVAFRAARVVGPGWALLPSAAGVVDPLLSTGFPLTLLGVARVLEILTETGPGDERDAALRAYETTTLDELEHTERLVAGLYGTMHDPELFKRLALMYFAAASYSEARMRMGAAMSTWSFLLCTRPGFAAELRRCSELAGMGVTGDARRALLARIDAAIAPIDIAGLGDRRRCDWYDVRAEDVRAGAAKLGASVHDIDALLVRSGFTPA